MGLNQFSSKLVLFDCDSLVTLWSMIPSNQWQVPDFSRGSYRKQMAFPDLASSGLALLASFINFGINSSSSFGVLSRMVAWPFFLLKILGQPGIFSCLIYQLNNKFRLVLVLSHRLAVLRLSLFATPLGIVVCEISLCNSAAGCAFLASFLSTFL